MRLIAPFGFYGAGNIGDESTLQGFARLVSAFDPRARAWVASRNPSHTRQAEPSFGYFNAERRDLRRRWAWMTSDAVVFPGGTPIMDALGDWPFCEFVPLIDRAIREKKPVVFIGTGTERLRHDRSKSVVERVLAPNVVSWTVRCVRDRDRLIEYGVPAEAVTATADQAWLLDRQTADAGREMLARLGVDVDAPLIGVNVNIEDFVRAQRPDLLKTLAAFLDEAIDASGAHVLFLCNEVRNEPTFDLAASREVMSAMAQRHRATIVPNDYWPPQVMLSLIACCRMTISTRYHFCLFSALQEVPFIAVKRSDKVSDLCDDLGWPHAVGLEALSGEGLLSTFAMMESRLEPLRAELRNAVPKMRDRAARNDIALHALRERLGS